MAAGETTPVAPRPRVGALPAPSFLAHRGMSATCPENTLEAFRAAVAPGVDGVDVDCWLTRDGELVCLHDTTVDRTTTGSGATHDLTLADAASLRVDAGTWFAASWPNTLRVPTFTEVLDDIGGRTVLYPEAKNTGAAAAIVDRLERHGLLDTAMVQSFIQSELERVVAVGGHALHLTATSSYDPVAVRAAGVRHLGLSAALPTSLVAPARAAGLDVAVWVVDRRIDATGWLGAGATGFFSNDPLYLSGRSTALSSDPFRRGSYHHGHLASTVAGDRGTFCRPAAWGYTDTGTEYRGALQGWACPINGKPDADRFAITVTVQVDAAAAPSGWAGLYLCAADDRSYDDLRRRQPGLCGYHVLLHQSGELAVHIVDDGLPRSAARMMTRPVPPGGSATLRVDVTPAEVAVTRLDTAATIAIADATHRGGYFHLGRRAAAVRFSDVRISDAPITKE